MEAGESRRGARSTKALTASAMFAALIFVSIAFLGIDNGMGGFIHFGDALIFTAASVLPLPYGLMVAAVGPGLFNLVRGPQWLVFTVIIKPLMALCFTSRGAKILGSRRNIIAPFAAAAINIALYFVAGSILFGGWAAGAAGLWGDLVQGAGSIAFYFAIAKIMDGADIKARLFRF